LRLFAKVYPNLRHLVLSHVTVCPLIIEDPGKNSVAIQGDTQPTQLTKLTTLTLHTRMLEFMISIVYQLDLSSLTQLEVSPADYQTLLINSFSHLQTLAHSYKLVNWNGINCNASEINLNSNPKLQHIAFTGVTASLDPHWYPNILRTLPRITQLRCVKISGDLRRTLRADAWAPLDKVLSDPCFASVPADRELVVEHKLTKDKEVDSDEPLPPCPIPAEVLLNTQTSGAFTIHWIEHSPLQGAQDDVARPVNGCYIA
jgi:hypothetical protein